MPEFGTSGLRGLADELTDRLCATYAFAFAGQHYHDGSLLVGQDLRDSSSRIAEAVAAGARAAQLNIVDCGILPTPALALEAERRGTLAIMVTGSHIPANRNGLKFYTGNGEITKSDEAALLDAVAAAPSLDISNAPRFHIDATAREHYVSRFTDFFSPRALAGLTVGVWQQSSAARDVLPTILEQLGATVVRLAPSKVFIPIDTEAVDKDLRAKLRSWADEHKLDALVSTDGDADRPMVADADGRVIPGDILGPITACYLGATDVVTPVSANTLVDLMGKFKVHRCRIGSPYVIAGMETPMGRDGARVLGYEPNGGVLLGYTAKNDYGKIAPLMTRDSTLPIVSVLAEASARNVSLSELIADLPNRRTATDRLQDVSTQISRKLAAGLASGETDVLPTDLGPPISVDETDGARITFASGVIVTVRPSGNAPELRCYVEADTSDAAQAILRETLENLRDAVDQAQSR